MGAICTKFQAVTEGEEQDADIRKQIESEAKKERRVTKLLLLGAGESGKSTIFKQIRILFQEDFDDLERSSYVPVIHANVFQSIRTLVIGCKEFAESGEQNSSSKYVLQPENQAFGETLAEIDNPKGFPSLNMENALKIRSCWNDPAVQAAFIRGNELQIPDCTSFFLEKVLQLAAEDYMPSQEDILYARQQTTGIVETEFGPIKKENRYKLFDVGGQRNERRKWMHLFDGVTAIIFCVALSEYDQMLLEDEKKNRMMETKELFDWLLQQPWFAKTSFLVFLNKYDIFEKKALKVPLSVCDWFQDYQPITTSPEEIEHAYKLCRPPLIFLKLANPWFVEQKFEEAYHHNTASSNLDRFFRIYRTTAIDKSNVERTFDLVDDILTVQRLRQIDLL